MSAIALSWRFTKGTTWCPLCGEHVPTPNGFRLSLGDRVLCTRCSVEVAERGDATARTWWRNEIAGLNLGGSCIAASSAGAASEDLRAVVRLPATFKFGYQPGGVPETPQGAQIKDGAAAAKSDDKGIPFHMIANAGSAMRFPQFEHPVVLDLSLVRPVGPKIPIYIEHDKSLDMLMGQTNRLFMANDELCAEGTVTNLESDECRQVIAMAGRGFAWQASVGGLIGERHFVGAGETVVVNGTEHKGPIFVARGSLIDHISPVVLGADGATETVIGAA